MLSVSSLIEFLLGLLRDAEAQAEFARDPQAVLARHGLEGVTSQDICEAQPVLADTVGVQIVPGGQSRSQPDDDDVVRVIHDVVNRHTVDKQVIVKHDAPHYNTYNEYTTYTDNSIHADTVIQDSFNQDNDGVDNKGGVIKDSNVANGDQTDVGNTDEDTTVTDSFNEDNSETTTIVDSGNEETTTTNTATDSFNDVTTTTNAATDSFDDETSTAAVDVNNSYNADSSTDVGGDVDPDGVEADAESVGV
jgi:hypothetical protein